MPSCPRRTILICLAAAHLAVCRLDAVERLTVEVQETAGIRRFSYPAGLLLKLPKPVPAATTFRLLQGTKPVVAQFRTDSPAGTSDRWWLDFNVSLLPYQTNSYTVEYGSDVPAGPQRRGGFQLTRVSGAFLISNPPYLRWTVPDNLQGLIRSLKFGKINHLRADSPGLLIRGKNGRQYRVGGGQPDTGTTSARIVRQGPLAIVIRFEPSESRQQLSAVHWVVDLTFSVSKSWVRVDWTVEDPKGHVASLGARLHLNLDKPGRQHPALVDFGATTLVYTALAAGQRAELRAGSAVSRRPGTTSDEDDYLWQVFRGKGDRLEPFVFGPKRSKASARPEGWAHLMDRGRCLALAISNFARAGRDRIIVSAEGDVSLWRDFAVDGAAPKPGRKRLRFGLHFVSNPPHISAATSPQSMQLPLLVRVKR